MEIDFFALFLALGEARLAEARTALALDGGGTPDHERAAAALVPMAIDAALLGAEGLATLFDAASVGIGIAAGVSMGTSLGRMALTRSGRGYSRVSGQGPTSNAGQVR